MLKSHLNLLQQKFYSILFLSILISLFTSSAFAYTTNMNASVVIGQTNFTTGLVNQGGTVSASTLSSPAGFYSNGQNLIVADQMNHRVLIYNSIPNNNNAVANVVIGQTNFTSNVADQGGAAGANTLDNPRGVCSDGTKLLVVDNNNNRVLIYNTIPVSNNVSADVVIGQVNFTSTTPNQSDVINKANYIRQPRNCFIDTNGKLYISDTGNHRVLIYNSIPVVNNTLANLVIGQTDFTTSSGNQGGLGANTLFSPGDIYSDGFKLFIADQGNNRVLIYNSIPVGNKPSADVVIGQINLTSGAANQGGVVNSNTLNGPRGVYVANGKLFIGDFSNNRVLIYSAIPTSNNASANVVIGQADFSSNTANQGGAAAANTLSGPGSNSVYVVGSKLLIGDTANNRVLIYVNLTPLAAPSSFSANITWSTDNLTSSQVEYGTTTAYGTSTSITDTSPRVTNHSVTLTGLLPNTNYHYRVRSISASGDEVISNDSVFITAFAPTPTSTPIPTSSSIPTPSSMLTPINTMIPTTVSSFTPTITPTIAGLATTGNNILKSVLGSLLGLSIVGGLTLMRVFKRINLTQK